MARPPPSFKPSESTACVSGLCCFHWDHAEHREARGASFTASGSSSPWSAAAADGAVLLAQPGDLRRRRAEPPRVPGGLRLWDGRVGVPGRGDGQARGPGRQHLGRLHRGTW